ncbi:tyrosinase family protein [Methylocystis sp. B8]|uniref:tyrosinase family protein n=1 Tax=Methylocystis sp. B8 TaxID=544938 RepID=UPI0010FD8758|nr:tyrosinase family protein [Methylocystis sp. B8]TLG71579.1 tyrosinase family protein [Methylocystis sp. B8]
MAVVRKNISQNADVRDQYIQGVQLLKKEASGRKTNEFGIPGAARSVSTYDLFVIWHVTAMMLETPPGNPAGRNSAHRGPVFAPWHRVMLMLYEQNLQRVLNDSNFGLPYWDWAEDGDLPQQQQGSAAIWSVDCMGGQGNPVTTGPFAFRQNDPATFRVRISVNTAGELRSVNRGLRRAFGVTADALPKTAHVTNALALSPYDMPSWDADTNSFRNRIEGWMNDDGVSETWLHNLVHVWVGGEMLLGSSPNDPVFFLNHCNIDRLWESWMTRNGRVYVPDMTAGADLKGHRIDDPISSPLGRSATPRETLDVSAIYEYDALL